MVFTLTLIDHRDGKQIARIEGIDGENETQRSEAIGFLYKHGVLVPDAK